MEKVKEDCFAFFRRKDGRAICKCLKKLDCIGCNFYKTKTEQPEIDLED